MPMISVPSGRNAVRLAALGLPAVIALALAPALLLCAFRASGRVFVLALLEAFRSWTVEIIGDPSRNANTIQADAQPRSIGRP
jgi:hypothetical protein